MAADELVAGEGGGDGDVDALALDDREQLLDRPVALRNRTTPRPPRSATSEPGTTGTGKRRPRRCPCFRGCARSRQRGGGERRAGEPVAYASRPCASSPSRRKRVRQHSSEDVVTHQGEPASLVAHSPDGPRLEPIEDTESDRAGHTGRQPERHAEEGDPNSGQFVDHDVARVYVLVRREVCGAHLADRETRTINTACTRIPGRARKKAAPPTSAATVAGRAETGRFPRRGNAGRAASQGEVAPGLRELEPRQPHVHPGHRPAHVPAGSRRTGRCGTSMHRRGERDGGSTIRQASRLVGPHRTWRASEALGPPQWSRADRRGRGSTRRRHPAR